MIKKFDEIYKKQTRLISKIVSCLFKIVIILFIISMVLRLLPADLMKLKLLSLTAYFTVNTMFSLGLIIGILITLADIRDDKIENLNDSYRKLAMAKEYKLPEIKSNYQKTNQKDLLQKLLTEAKSIINELNNTLKNQERRD